MPLHAWTTVGETLPTVVLGLPTSALRAFGVKFKPTVVFNRRARGKLEQRGYPRRVVALFVDGILPFPKAIEETRKLSWVEQVSKEFEEDLRAARAR